MFGEQVVNRQRVGIITWHSDNNYGTILQAYALCRMVEYLGYLPSIINYIPPQEEHVWSVRRFLGACYHHIFKRGTFDYISDIQLKKFKAFRNRLNLTPLCDTAEKLQNLNRTFDAFICGSDQIWTPRYFNDKYYLSFVNDTNKMIAYAPSLGATGIEDEFRKEQMRKAILRFTHLSVREEKGAELIWEITGKEAKVVLDPTLLYTAEEWKKMLDLENAEKPLDRYLLCYILGDIRKYERHIRSVSKALNLPIFIVPTKRAHINMRGFHPFDAGPVEFVSAMQNASFVCTDSYHGLIFSLIFGNQFCCYERFFEQARDNQNNRIYDLLTKLNLMDRLYKPGNEDIWMDNIDYSKVWEKIEMLKKDSIDYLCETLKQAAGDT